MTQQDINLQKRLCSNCIYTGLIEGIEAKENEIQQEISDLNTKIWLYFSQLMDEDCLNSARPDQFLPMKNYLKIKLLNEAQTGDATSANATNTPNNNEASGEIDLRK